MAKEKDLPLLHSMDLEEVRHMIRKVQAISETTKSERLYSQMNMVEIHLFDRQDELGYDDYDDYGEMMFYSGGGDYSMSDQDIENYYHDLKCGGDRFDYEHDDRNESHEKDDEREPYVRYHRPSIVQLLKEAKSFALKCEHEDKRYLHLEEYNRFTGEMIPFCHTCHVRLKK